MASRPNVRVLGQRTRNLQIESFYGTTGPLFFTISKLRRCFRSQLIAEFMEISRVCDDIAHSENRECVLRRAPADVHHPVTPQPRTRNSTSINYQKQWVHIEEPQMSSKGSSKITSRSSSPLFPKCPLHQKSQDRCSESCASVGSLELSSSAG